MSRLPNPGSDDGTWGDILNDFLSVEHNGDGTLKARSDGSFATLDSGKIPTSQLASGTASDSNFLRGDGTWAVPAGTTTPDADSTTKGKIQLSGDLSGTAASPQVVATHLSSALPLSQGGTGSTTQNFVDLTNAQTVGGAKSFTSAIDLSAVSGTVSAMGSSIGDKIALYSTGYGFGVQSSRLVAYVGGSTAGFAVRQAAGSGDRSSGVDGVVLNANGTGTFASNITMTSGNMGLLATANAATHTLTLGSTATGLALYNTADQTTNYERLRMYWSSNVAYLHTEMGGTGVNRELRVGSTTVNYVGINNVGGGTSNSPKINLYFGATGNLYGAAVNGTFNNSANTAAVLTLAPVFSQTGTAGYTALLINPTETTTGSGTKLLADFQVGGTSKTSIDNGGNHIFHSGAGAYLYNTADETTNYERGRIYWSGSMLNIVAESGGTGTSRSINMVGGFTTFQIGAGGVNVVRNNTTVPQLMTVTSTGLTASSSNQTALIINPTVSQTGTAGYTGLQVNITESTTGSGTKLLADFQVGGVSKVSIDNSGNQILHNGAGTYSYGTTDETVNYERIHSYWSGSAYFINAETAGTGQLRSIAINASTIVRASVSVNGSLQSNASGTAAGGVGFLQAGTFAATSGLQYPVSVAPTINQTATAGYTALLVNPTETATGSGAKLLADFQVGGTSKLSISNTGTLTIPLNAGTGKVLVSDTNGAATWQTLNGSYVDLTSSQTIGGTKTFSGSIVTSGHQNIATYLFVGSASAPVNTNTGDLTAMRLNIGNTAFLTTSTFVNLTGNIADTANAATVHTQIQPTIMPASDSQASYRALNMSSLVQTSSNFITNSLITAGFFENRVVNAGTVNQLHGLTTTGLMGASTMSTLGTVTTVRAIEAQAINSFSNSVVATIQTAVGVHVSNPGINTLVLTSQAGINIDALSGATNNTSLLIGQTSIPSGNYSIYSASTSNNYFAGSLGLGTNSPTHGLTLSSTNTGIALYNTSDQTTNYERLRQYWSGNTFTITTENGGTGSARPVQLSAGGGTLALAGLLAFSKSTGSAAVTLFTLYGTQSQSTGTVTGMGITPSISQTGTAGYTALLVNPTEASTGSGAKLLADFQVGSVSKFSVDNSGVVIASNRITGVGNPTSPQDAATKNYVDSLIGTTQLINAQTGTTYTLVASDVGKLITLTNAAAVSLTVPTNATVAYAIGARIDLAQTGAGQVTVVPAAGVTVNATPGLKLSSQYAGATLIKTATDTWLLFGSLAV